MAISVPYTVVRDGIYTYNRRTSNGLLRFSLKTRIDLEAQASYQELTR